MPPGTGPGHREADGLRVLRRRVVGDILVVRGRGMGERELRRARDQERAFRAYVQEAAAPGPKAPGAKADELGRLAALHDRGAITDAEYERAKAKVLAV